MHPQYFQLVSRGTLNLFWKKSFGKIMSDKRKLILTC